jgi:branched-chain amino acid transport system substrate-binding protein
MKKGLFLTAIIFSIAVVMAFSACGPKGPETIKIGVNAPITGDIPKVGEGSKFAAEMWLEDINAAGGLQVGDKKYKVELVIEDNESKAESAVKVATKLITDDEVLAIVGPQSSKQAIPAGGKANEMSTPMISPWSTNPDTTKDRPYVFRGCFLDPFQGPVAANFIRDEFGFTKAAVLYDVASDYPKGLAEFFKEAWEKNNGPGSVVAFESFTTKDTDFSSQLTKIINSGAEVLFTPQYYNEVALIVQQAHQLGAATGATKEFIDRYNAKHGYVPDDVGALTWDSIRLLQQAIQNTGGLSGDIKKDRTAVKDQLAKIKQFEGITGNMDFTEDGDPIKCAVVVRISDAGEYEFYKSVCP